MALAAAAAAAAAPAIVPIAPEPPQELLVVDPRSCPPAWLPTLACLQGMLARQGSTRQLFLSAPSGGQALWLEELVRTHGIRLALGEDPERILRELGSHTAGYIRCDVGDPSSVDSAFMLGILDNALVVDRRNEAAARAAGLACVADSADAATPRRLAENRPSFNSAALLEQSGRLNWELRDYQVMARLATSQAAETEEMAAVIESQQDRPIFGWGNAAHGENRFIRRNSEQGLFTLASDHATNLSVLSAFRQTGSSRGPGEKPVAPVAERHLHLVTFVLTDGDNVGWVLGSFASNARWFGSPARGHIPMGYGLPPILSDLAPDALAWFHRQAEADEGNDDFVAGPSGTGYFFPSRYPPAALRRDVDRLDSLMQRADLHLAQVLDEHSLDRTDLWSAYLREPQIDGLIYLEYAPYNGGRGRIVWAAGKPVVSARLILWQGVQGGDPAEVEQRIATAPRDLDFASGYTLVSVHAWTHTPADVAALIRRLPPGVRAVTPGIFFATLRSHLHPPP